MVIDELMNDSAKRPGEGCVGLRDNQEAFVSKNVYNHHGRSYLRAAKGFYLSLEPASSVPAYGGKSN